MDIRMENFMKKRNLFRGMGKVSWVDEYYEGQRKSLKKWKFTRKKITN